MDITFDDTIKNARKSLMETGHVLRLDTVINEVLEIKLILHISKI